MDRKDILGLALQDYADGKQDACISVWSELPGVHDIPIHYLHRSLEDMPDTELWALQACKGHVLDVGAGAGCHSLQLQEMGHRVTALERSKGAVEHMRELGIEEVVQADIMRFKQGSYDSILLLMNGIGIAGKLKGLTPFLKKLNGLLNPGGIILADSADVSTYFTEADGSQTIDLNKEHQGEVSYQMAYKEFQGEPFSWLFLDQQTLREHAESLGFVVELLMEGKEGEYLLALKRP